MTGIIQADQDISFQAMSGEAAGPRPTSSRTIPPWTTSWPSRRAAAASPTPAACSSSLKPLDERKVTADQVIARLRGQAGQRARAPACTCSPSRTSASAAALGNAQYQYTLQGDDCQGARSSGRPGCWRGCAALPELVDVSSDQQNQGLQATLVIDRDTASRLGITAQLIDNTLYDAFGQRQVSTMYTAAQPVPRGHGGGAPVLAEPRLPARTSTSSPAPGPWCRCRAFAHYQLEQRRPGREPPGPVPVGHHLLQPAAGRGPGRRGDGDREGRASRSACRPPSTAASRAPPRPSRPRWPTSRSSSSPPSLAVYIVLGMLYESLHPPHHHPLHPALGRRGRPAGAARSSAPTSASSPSSASSCSSAS